ncbi:hypothetical protein FE782_06300 [Paenibacillus antri]|uniref:Uncharacterized protein n=1 Tax=Paenibacillus antri TaxID=2582848 RepID=A0A5R9GCZ6_9BACL|nr:hypothetical protein [Paenibacillus antri]TLS52979.1 hypothetical protein FE782_06300 [Paenibacillus antri]
MRGPRKQNLLFYVIVGLIAIGILSMIVRNPSGAIIPVVVLGGVFLLYKYPPQRWKFLRNDRRDGSGMWGASDGGVRKGRTTKRAKFRVIQGNKPDDDDKPKYH